MMEAYNPSTTESRQEDGEFQASLGYMEGTCLKKRGKGIWGHWRM
jgi:hypothetical protein